ncbi:MAG TPA: FHA domain-containing protein [Acidimicrobiales bacterium]|nr:FHA domain-containing protein [Acidimicrobiales bacterium]
MPDSLLTILKFCFLAVLYLFFVRVLRAVWAEMREPAAAVSVPAAQSSAAARPAAARQTWANKGGSRLRVIEPAQTRGQTYDLGDELTLGRAAGCQVTIDDTFVSQLHARLFRRDAQYFVEDLGSTNGTYLNRNKVAAPVAIRKGDRLQVGKTVLELI